LVSNVAWWFFILITMFSVWFKGHTWNDIMASWDDMKQMRFLRLISRNSKSASPTLPNSFYPIIVNSGGDQVTTAGNSFQLFYDTGTRVRLYGRQPGMTGPTLPVRSAAAVYKPPKGDPVLLVAHQTIHNDNPSLDKLLLLPFQLEGHVMNVNILWRSLGGRQQIVVDDLVIYLHFDERKMYFPVQRPTEHEMQNLELYELSSLKPFKP